MISIVIPAHNEEGSIAGVVAGIRAARLPDLEVIVVDDGSSDGTAARAEQAGARVLRHPYNIGNGAAVKTGIRGARGDVIVTMDADGQHDPADIPRLLALLGPHDMVVGERQWAGRSWHRNIANLIYNGLATYVAGVRIRDLTSGFRAVKAPLAKSLVPLLPNTFSYPSTITLSVCKYGHSLAYVPIRAVPRGGGRSKINIVRDGLRFLLIITRVSVLFSPMKVFLPLSLLFFLAGLVHLVNTFVTVGRFMPFSLVMFVTSVLLFSLGLISEQVSMLRLSIVESRGERD